MFGYGIDIYCVRWLNRYPGLACDIPCEFIHRLLGNSDNDSRTTNDADSKPTRISSVLPRTHTGPLSTPQDPKFELI